MATSNFIFNVREKGGEAVRGEKDPGDGFFWLCSKWAKFGQQYSVKILVVPELHRILEFRENFIVTSTGGT